MSLKGATQQSATAFSLAIQAGDIGRRCQGEESGGELGQRDTSAFGCWIIAQDGENRRACEPSLRIARRYCQSQVEVLQGAGEIVLALPNCRPQNQHLDRGILLTPPRLQGGLSAAQEPRIGLAPAAFDTFEGENR